MRCIQLMVLIFALLVSMTGVGDEPGQQPRPTDRAATPLSPEVLMDAMGTILGFYHGAEVTTRFCKRRFLDMEVDLELTLAQWYTRNGPIAAAARRVVLERSLVPNEQELDENLQVQLRSYMSTIKQFDAERQKIHCFDTMVMMDDEANDIRHRYAREYQLLQSL